MIEETEGLILPVLKQMRSLDGDVPMTDSLGHHSFHLGASAGICGHAVDMVHPVPGEGLSPH